ncbi:MAG: class I SAM-dependent methyltransferase [Alphaproteobacteria bacterium]
MTTPVTDHYTSGDLLDRLRAALRQDGVDPDRPTLADLAPYDQFHGRGLEATEELAATLDIAASDHVLDVGSGIGGPARLIADRFGCRVTGIDLTPEFCAVARHITRLVGLDSRVVFEQGDALAMPFAAGTFDGAYSLNVAMNIADKPGFYREIHRVLKPKAWVVLAEIGLGPGAPVEFPTPWAATAEASFLATPEATRLGLEAAGFAVTAWRDTLRETLAYNARMRAAVERGEKSPQRVVQLVHGDRAAQASANIARGLAEGGLIPIEIRCRKRD